MVNTAGQHGLSLLESDRPDDVIAPILCDSGRRRAPPRSMCMNAKPIWKNGSIPTSRTVPNRYSTRRCYCVDVGLIVPRMSGSPVTIPDRVSSGVRLSRRQPSFSHIGRTGCVRVARTDNGLAAAHRPLDKRAPTIVDFIRPAQSSPRRHHNDLPAPLPATSLSLTLAGCLRTCNHHLKPASKSPRRWCLKMPQRV